MISDQDALRASHLTGMPVAYTCDRGWHLIVDPQEVHKLCELAREADTEPVERHRSVLELVADEDFRTAIRLLSDLLAENNAGRELRRLASTRAGRARRRLRVVA